MQHPLHASRLSQGESQDAQQALRCERRPGKRDAVTEREVDLMLYKVEGKLSTHIQVSRASMVLGVGGGLPSG